MKFLLLRFQYAVEIGAYLAYVGHYEKSKDSVIRRIKHEELRHMIQIKRVLKTCGGRKPWIAFNLVFLIIGNIIRVLCKITPLVILDGVAQLMEVFNIISYDYFAREFPYFRPMFKKMSEQESQHEIYFSTFPKYGRSEII
jgi:rubrerythrin